MLTCNCDRARRRTPGSVALFDDCVCSCMHCRAWCSCATCARHLKPEHRRRLHATRQPLCTQSMHVTTSCSASRPDGLLHRSLSCVPGAVCSAFGCVSTMTSACPPRDACGLMQQSPHVCPPSTLPNLHAYARGLTNPCRLLSVSSASPWPLRLLPWPAPTSNTCARTRCCVRVRVRWAGWWCGAWGLHGDYVSLGAWR